MFELRWRDEAMVEFIGNRIWLAGKKARFSSPSVTSVPLWQSYFLIAKSVTEGD
jgi:hypothetical protein